MRHPQTGPPGPGPGAGARARAGGNFRPPARAPRGAPGSPPGTPPGTPPGAPRLGPIYSLFVLQEGVFGPPGGTPLGPPSGRPRPGGQKSAHFFGYLITLPVGTVWATFSAPARDPPPRANPPPGGSGQGQGPVLAGRAVIIGRHQTQSAPRSVTVR